jgi:DHA1 family tetracycline resistance protein-like MFS transporter
MHKKVLITLFFTLVLDMVGLGMVIPIIPIIFTDPNSSSFLLSHVAPRYWYFLAGLTTAIFGLVQFFAAPLLGELSDVYGRKKLLFVGVSILAVSQCIFGLGIITKSLTLIFLSRFVGGLAAANFSIAQATIADISTPETRAKNFGLIGAAFGIGFIVGPALSGYLAHTFESASAPFWIAGLLGVCNMVLVSLFLPETHKENRREARQLTFLKAIHNIKTAFTDHDISHIYRANFFYFTGFTFFSSFSGLYLVEKYKIEEAGLGTYFTIIGVCIIITQMIILRIVSKHKKPLQVLKGSMIVAGVTLALTPFMPTLMLQYILIPCIAVPHGLSIANLGALLSSSVNKEKQGVALGINGSLSAFAQGVVPLLSGVLGSAIGIRLPFILGGVCIAFAWYGIIQLRHRE